MTEAGKERCGGAANHGRPSRPRNLAIAREQERALRALLPRQNRASVRGKEGVPAVACPNHCPGPCLPPASTVRMEHNARSAAARQKYNTRGRPLLISNRRHSAPHVWYLRGMTMVEE